MLLSCYRQSSIKTVREQWVYGSRFGTRFVSRFGTENGEPVEVVED